MSGLAGGFGLANPGCRIMCLRMGWSIDYYGSEWGITTMSYVAEAFVYAANMGVRAINYSFGSGAEGGIEAATDYAIVSGVTICAAAGNDDSSVGLGYLQSRPDVICVAATDQNDGKSYFSNYGTLVDIAAPGSDIWSTVSYHYTPGYAVYSGTSMAAPHVVGVTGLILSANPGLTREEVLGIITATADSTTNYIGQMGAGRINAYRAVLEAKAFRISHVPLGNTSDTANPYTVVATIHSDTTLNADSLSLFYRSSAVVDTSFIRVPLLPTGTPEEYTADIPPQPVYSVIEYGLTAENVRGDRVAAPDGFPTSMYSFRILGIPILASYPDAFDVELPSGYTDAETLVVRNDGTDDLLFSLGVGRLDTAVINQHVRVVLAANAAIAPSANAATHQGDPLTAPAPPRMTAQEVMAQRSRFTASAAAPMFAVVLDSWGADNADRTHWDYLNANYGDFGTAPILIDYATFNHNDITYAELDASQADVLIVSDAWNAYNWEFTPLELAAIREYVEEGHGLFVTGGTLDYENAPGHMAAFATLLGLDSAESYRWSWGWPEAQDLQVVDHPLFRNVPDPYMVSYDITDVPLTGTWWDAATEAQVIAISADGSTATTAFGNRVYTSVMPEEVARTGQTPADDQFTYNAIVYCAGGICDWLSAEPVSGVVPPQDSVLVNVRLDAQPFHQDTTLTCQINLRALDSVGSNVAIPVRMHVLPPEYYVDLSPTSAAGVGPARDTVWYTDTLSNFGANDDSYHLILSHAQWPTSVWDSAGTSEIMVTPTLSQNDRYVIRPRVIIPDTARYGQADTLQLTVRSDGDPMIDAEFQAITYSAGRPDSIPWLDQFPSMTLDTMHWQIISGATVDDRGIDEPSPPYSLNLNGDPSGGDRVTSVPINLAGQIQVVLSYWFERTGGGEWVDPGEDLIFEVLDDSSRWVEVSRQPGSGQAMSAFQHVEVILPRSCYRRDFQLRIRSIGSACLCDDWFVDDVLLYAPIPPSICYAPDSFAFNLAEDDSTKDTLIVCNNGPGELRFRISLKSDQPPLAGSAFPRLLPQYDVQLHGIPAIVAEPTARSTEPAPTILTGWGLADDFEDGDFDGWQIGYGSYERGVTSATAANGSSYSFQQVGGQYNHYDGVGRVFPAGQYGYVGFSVRLGTTTDAAGYVVVGDENTTWHNGTIFFYAGPSGQFVVSPGDASFPYERDRWYRVEFYLDWERQMFDYYVDGDLIAAHLPFRNSTVTLSQAYLYNFYPSTAWWDEIAIGDGPMSRWLSLWPQSDTIAAGETTRVEININTNDIGSGNYRRIIGINSNDPYEPEIDVPVSLRVRGPEIVARPDTMILDYVAEGAQLDDRIQIVNIGEDTLIINDVTTDAPWLRRALKFDRLSPGDSAVIDLAIDARGLLPGPYRGHLTVMSNDFDEGELVIPVLIRVGLDPEIAVMPESLALVADADDTNSATLAVLNTGLGTLGVLDVLTDYMAAFEGAQVLETSPAFTSPASGSGDHPTVTAPGGDPDPATLYSSASLAAPASAPGPTAADVGLEEVRINLNAQFASVTAAIPHRFDFSEGESGSYIVDGGDNMYDYGNYLYANCCGEAWYSNDSIVSSSQFGIGGRYFTRKYPGRFVLAADMQDVGAFTIYGDLGADGMGVADGAVLQVSYAGRTFYGFVKRVHGTDEPSVNHLIIVEKAVWHSFSTYTGDDYHRVYDLYGAERLYYLLYAGTDGHYIDNAATLQIMRAFLAAAGVTPQWISVRPESLLVAPGSSSDLTVTVDTRGLPGPDHRATLSLLTNDLHRDTVVVPVRLHVRSPEIAVRPTDLAMDALEGQTTDSVLWIMNTGDGPLHALISGDSAWLVPMPESVAVAAMDSFALVVRADASALIPGNYGATLRIQSDDFDDPEVAIPVTLHVGPDPDVDMVPESLSVTLTSGDSLVTPFDIRNLGQGTLAFVASVGLSGQTALAPRAEPYPDWYEDPVPHESRDARVGRPVTQGAGGPDSTGYSWIDSDEPGGPPFHWVDISATGTPVTPLQPDGFNGPFPVGFEFPFYDSTYNQFWISTKGFIGFGPPEGYFYWSNTPLPSPSIPNNIIAWYWDDLRPSSGANPTEVYYRSEPGRLIVQFTRYRHWCCDPGPWITGEVIIYANGSIVTQTLEVQPGFPVNGETVGIENITGTDGLEVAFNTPYIHDSLAVRFSRVPSWLTVDPGQGRVAPQGALTMNVHMSAAGLAEPDYHADIILQTNDPDELTTRVPVHLHVRSPDISLHPTSFRMDVTEGSPTDSALWIINSGDGDLHVAAGGDSTWLTPIPESVTVVPSDSFALMVRVNGAAMIPGEYAAVLTITSNDVDESEILVPVIAAVGPDPDIAVVPESLVVTLTAGDSVVTPLEIQNLGQGTLAFEASVGFSVHAATTQNHEPYPAWYYDPVSKESPDLRQGRPVTQGAGGPDSAGYRWIDSDELGGPQFQWKDIAGTGIPVDGLGDDNFVGPFPVGFDFPYYDSSYSQFWIASNGYIGFGPTDAYWSLGNMPMPWPDPPNNIIVWSWKDLFPYGGADPTRIYYQSSDGRLVVQFDRVRMCCGEGPWITAEVILYRTGQILIQYREVQPGFPVSWGTVGIENITGTDGLEVAFNTPYVHDSLAVRFSRVPTWLTIDPEQGRVAPLGALTMNARVSAADLADPDYYAGVTLQTNDPDELTKSIPVHLHVRSPEIALRPTSLRMEVTEGSPLDSTLWVINSGDGGLHVAASGDSTWLSAIPESVTVAPSDSFALTVRVDGAVLIPGEYAAVLTITSNDVDESEILVPVIADVGPDPDIAVVPESLYLSVTLGDSLDTALVVRNDGAGTLGFTVEVARGIGGPATARWTQVALLPAPEGRSSADPADASPTPPASYSTQQGPMRVALFQDWDPWGSTSLRDLMTAHGIAYDLWGTASMGAVDLSVYDKVITASNQGDDFYLALSSHRLWFEDYVRSGGILELHLACNTWTIGGLPMPGGFAASYLECVDEVTIADSLHPIMTTPNAISGPMLNWWNCSLHGYLASVPSDARIIVTRTFDGAPACAEVTLGRGLIIATLQTVEWYGASLPYLENMLLYAHTGVEWLRVAPDSGRVRPSEQAVLDVQVATSGLKLPAEARIIVSSNDPDEDMVTVPVRIHLRSPEVALRPDTLRLDVTEGISTDSTLWLINSGDGDLHVAASANSSWLSAIPESVTVAPSDSFPLTVRANGSALIPGEYASALTVASNDYDEPVLVVPVLVHVGPDPDIAIVPESLVVTLTAGDSTIMPLSIRNLGLGTLSFVGSIGYAQGSIVAGLAPLPRIENPDPPQTTWPWPIDATVRAIVSAMPVGMSESTRPAAVPLPGTAAGIAFSPSGQLYYADEADNSIWRLDSSGSWEVFSRAVTSPFGIAFSPTGDLAVAELFEGNIKLVHSDGTAELLASGLGAPLGLAYGPDGALYVTTDGSYAVFRVTSEGAVSVFASGLPYTTYGAAFGPDGRLYVSTLGDGRIIAIDPDGTYSTYATIEATLDGLAFDVLGNLYCANGLNQTIYRVNPDQSVDVIGSGFSGILMNVALDRTGLLFISSITNFEIDTLRVGVPGVRLPVGGWNWLRLQPVSGRVAAGDSAVVEAHIDSYDLDAVDYPATIGFATNDPDETYVAIPVLLHVNPVATCVSRCHGDPQCDGVATVQDVVQVANVAFRGGMPIPDPSRQCPYETTDVNCDGSTNVIDVVRIVNVAFRGANPVAEFCDPCVR